MDARQRRCGELTCQWCGRKKLLIDRLASVNGPYTRLPQGALLLCPRCDEAGQGVGPLATIFARVTARNVEAQRSKEPE